MGFLSSKSAQPFIPIQGTGMDAAPFLVLFLLLLIASIALWRRPVQSRRLRLLVRLTSSALFIFVVFFSHCFLRLAAFSLSRIGWDDLVAFNDLYRLVIPLGFTLLVGPVFCGWICPFGFLQELISKLVVVNTRNGRLVALALLGLGTAVYLLRVLPSTDTLIENVPTVWTLALLLIVLLAVLKPALEPHLLKIRFVSLGLFLSLGAFLVFNEGWCVLYVNELDAAALLACLVILASALLIPFAWCRYLCPTGVLFSWIGAASLITGQRRCTPACHLSQSCERACVAKAADMSDAARAQLASHLKLMSKPLWLGAGGDPVGSPQLSAPSSQPGGGLETVSSHTHRRLP